MDQANPFADRTWEYWTEPEFVDIDGVRTAYRRGGSGPTLVYLHGGGGTREWNPLHRQLAEHYDVVAPEHPGFGDTTTDKEFDDWSDYILHYDAFFRALQLEDFHLVGTSLGSWLAANLAVYYPDRFKTLTLVTPMGVLVPADPFVDLFRLRPEEEASRMFNGREEEQLSDGSQYGGPEDAAHIYSEMTTAARLMWSPRYERRFDWRLRRIEAPTLVVAPGEDRLVGTGQSARFAELIPNAKLTVIPGPDGRPSAHGLPMEQPGEVANAIIRHTETTAKD